MLPARVIKRARTRVTSVLRILFKRSRKGTSQAISLTIFIPFSSSLKSLIRASVQTIDFLRTLKRYFMMRVCSGVKMRRKAIPTSADSLI